MPALTSLQPRRRFSSSVTGDPEPPVPSGTHDQGQPFQVLPSPFPLPPRQLPVPFLSPRIPSAQRRHHWAFFGFLLHRVLLSSTAPGALGALTNGGSTTACSLPWLQVCIALSRVMKLPARFWCSCFCSPGTPSLGCCTTCFGAAACSRSADSGAGPCSHRH